MNNRYEKSIDEGYTLIDWMVFLSLALVTVFFGLNIGNSLKDLYKEWSETPVKEWQSEHDAQLFEGDVFFDKAVRFDSGCWRLVEGHCNGSSLSKLYIDCGLRGEQRMIIQSKSELCKR